MKKSLIALAVAGAFAAPSAMAVEFSPTMYQSLALSFNGKESGGVTAAGDGNNVRSGGGSTIGFKFTDDLGNGMTAEAFVHFTTNLPNGHDNPVRFRNGYVGLSSNFGSFKLGTNEHVYEVGQIIDGWGSDWEGGGSVGFFNGAPTFLGISGWSFTRQDTNSVWWTSPSWGGFVIDAAYIGGPGSASVGGVIRDAEGMQLAAKWSNSFLTVSGAWADYSEYGLGGGTQAGAVGFVDASGNPATNTVQSTNTTYGGAFFNDVSGTQDATGLRLTILWTAAWGNLGGSWNTMESENSLAPSTTKNEGDTFQITGTFNLASGRIIANYNQADDQDYGGVNIPNSGATGFDIGYQHDLSAYSYVFVRWEQNEGDENYKNKGATTGGKKEESDALMLGLKVSY